MECRIVWLLSKMLGFILVVGIQIKNGHGVSVLPGSKKCLNFSAIPNEADKFISPLGGLRLANICVSEMVYSKDFLSLPSHCLLVDVDIYYNGSKVGGFDMYQTEGKFKDSPFAKMTGEVWPKELGESCQGVKVSFDHVSNKGKDRIGSIILGATFMYELKDGVGGKLDEKKLLRCINATEKKHKEHVEKYNWLSSIPKLNGKDGRKVKPHEARYGWNIRDCCPEKRNATCCPEGAIFVRGGEGNSCQCKQGYYYDHNTFVCHRCRKGTYLPETNMEKCQPCPDGTTTLAEGSTSCISILECRTEVVWTVEGTFTWETTEVRKTAKHKCPYGPDNVTLSRNCYWSSSNTASWATFDSTICNPSKHTKTLLALSETPITESNVNNVTELLVMETEAATELDSYDVALATATIIDIVDFNSSSEEVTENVMQVINNILSVSEDVLVESQIHNRSTSRLINITERFAENLPLVHSVSHLVAANIEIKAQAFTNQTFNKGFTYVANLDPQNSSSAVLPQITITANTFQQAVQQGSTRVISIIYKNNKLFPVFNAEKKLAKEKLDNEKEETSKIGDIVLAGKFKDARINMVDEVIQIKFPVHMKNISGLIPRCVFWDFAANDGYGNWSSEGCFYLGTNSSQVTCVCNHMTNFAILLTADPDRDETDSHHRHVLSMISYIGCGVSLFAVILTLLTYVFFRDLRRSNAQIILCHLCVALIGLLVLYFAVATRDPKTTDCLVSSLLVHYFLLATFAWMGVEGVNMYLAFVKVMSAHVPRFMPKAVVVAWGIPVLVVVITGAIAFQEYSTEESCFLHGVAFYVSAFTPAILVLSTNFIMFALTLYSLSQMGKEVSQENKFKGYERVKVALAIMVLLGLTWFFGTVAIGSARLLFQYLFCIFNSLQGFAIFWFHCVRQPEVRQCWADFLRGRRGRKRRYTASTTAPALATNAVKKSSSTASPKLSSFPRRGKYNVEQNVKYVDLYPNSSV